MSELIEFSDKKLFDQGVAHAIRDGGIDFVVITRNKESSELIFHYKPLETDPKLVMTAEVADHEILVTIIDLRPTPDRLTLEEQLLAVDLTVGRPTAGCTR